VNIELINTGSELLLGKVLNTHQQWICRQLADAGYEVSRQVCVSDDGPAIQAAAREALGRADLVITTGGLGPTSDDLTRELLAQLLGRKLVYHPEIMERIERYFAARKRTAPSSCRVEAMAPEGAVILPNQFGTASGLAIEVNPNPFRASGKSWLILLPGPPRELRPMFTDSVLPLIRRELPLSGPFVCRTLRTAGLGESLVEQKVAPLLASLLREGMEIGYCARVGEVDVRLVARGKDAERRVADGEKIVREALGETLIFGVDWDSLESVVVRLLTERGQTLALAESCTGGFLANRITNVPGASAVLKAGLVTYSNESKQQLLGVRAETLAKHGAVSEETAREMAEGARQRLGTDFAIALTGIAGPGGGTETKPVGTVFMAVAEAGKTTSRTHFNNFDRETFKFISSQQAMSLLRERLIAG